MTVWHSYRHKNEVFPATGEPSASFDAAPAYVYANVTGACGKGDTNPNVFTNLDENSQLGLDYMFSQPAGASDKIQILFQGKVNRANYDYMSRTSSSPRKTAEVRISKQVEPRHLPELRGQPRGLQPDRFRAPAATTLGTNLSYQGKSFDMGGCQGCHGNAQQRGAEMSFLGAGGANSAEADRRVRERVRASGTVPR